MDIRIDVINAYRELESIRAVSKALNISQQTIRRILIEAGEYQSERSMEINRLFREGMPPQEIAEKMGVSQKSVISYLPYSRNPYVQPAQKKTKNALQIANWRWRKKRL